MRTFNIGFVSYDEYGNKDEHDETQFTIMNSSFERMTAELLKLFNMYILESGCDRYRISYIEETLSDVIDDE